MQELIREPLVHFLLIGAALFVVFGLVNEEYSSEADKRVVVSAGRIAQLENIFAKTWHRPPTEQELTGLVNDFVLEEIYYRQAIAMGIDRDDTVIRRRLRQKFKFLTDDIAASATPTNEELAAYVAANPDTFMRDTTYTFEQMYINPIAPGSILTHMSRRSSPFCEPEERSKEIPASCPHSSTQHRAVLSIATSEQIFPPSSICCHWVNGAGRSSPALAFT